MQTTLFHHHILEQIDIGGMGVVYRPHEVHLAREVALKAFIAETAVEMVARNRIHREVLTLPKLNHPNNATSAIVTLRTAPTSWSQNSLTVCFWMQL